MFVQGVPPYTQVPLTWIPLTQFFATLLHQSFSKQLMTFCDAEHSKLSEKEAQMSQGNKSMFKFHNVQSNKGLFEVSCYDIELTDKLCNP